MELKRHSMQEIASRIGSDLYTISTVATMIGRSTNTIRRWLRLKESPKPSHRASYGLIDMQLWDDDDVAVLRRWASGIKPGPRPKAPMTERRQPDQPFNRDQGQPVVTLKDAERLPPKERPAEKWARIKGGKVVEKKVDTGKNEVTVLALQRDPEEEPRRIKKRK